MSRTGIDETTSMQRELPVASHELKVYLNLADALLPTEEDLEAFRSSAGGWPDIDAEKLISELNEQRLVSTRPITRP